MVIRYFYKAGWDRIIRATYRLIEDEENKKVSEQIWLDGKWQPTDNLIKQIIGGEFDLHEVTKEDVRKYSPQVLMSD